MTSFATSRGGARHAVTLAGIVLVYYVAGRIGLSLAFVNASTSAVWPPAGIAVAALLLFGLRTWPAITVAAFLVNLSTNGRVLASVLIALGNTAEGLLAAWLTIRFAHGRHAFERTADIMRFTLHGALCASMVSATVGVVTLLATGLARPAEFNAIWVTWWLGDAVGMAVVTPLVLLWANPASRARGSILEGLLLGAALAATAYVPFGESRLDPLDPPAAIFVVPLLLWSAFRFGSRWTALVIVGMSLIATSGTLRGYGPFVRRSENEALLLLQLFVGVLSTVMLAVAAEVAVRRRVEEDVLALNESLERRVAERTEELTRVSDRLIVAQQVAQIGCWEWDVQADAVWWSDEKFRMYGLPLDTVPSFESFRACLHPDDRDRVVATVGQSLVEGSSFAFEHRIVWPNGEIRTVHALGRVEVDAAGKPVRVRGVEHDITELKRAEEERAQLLDEQLARRDAEEANRAKDAFLATLSHELRTPLNAALGWTQILRETPNIPANTARTIETIYRNLLIQARLVSDILDVTRIATGGLPLERESVDLSGVVDSALETVRDAAVSKRIRVDVSAADELQPIIGDSRRLQQVVWNLLSNAVKFASVGGFVRISLVPCASEIQLTVEDDGPGIAPDFLPHVFEQFKQADASLTREHGGLGLGLAIAQHIVHSHGGTIAAGNRPEGGAVFYVRLPQAAGEAEHFAS